GPCARMVSAKRPAACSRALSQSLRARASCLPRRSWGYSARARSDWESALEHAAGRFAETIREHGPDSVAFYISGQLLTEDYYAFNKLARALVGTNNIDSNSR
ncbi:molybdopterin-dependent oxidoreductase, partial [Pseudomonas aeruginosa]